MLRSASRLLGYRVTARDGEVGRCVDFLLDPRAWTVRYLLVEPAPRRSGQRLLVSPLGLRKLEWTPRRWVLELNRAEIERTLDAEPGLQSLEQLIGFGVDDAEGNVGHIEDLILDDDNWSCRYLVVNGEIRLSVSKLLLPTEWIAELLASEHRVLAPVSRALVQSEPEYRPEAPVYQLRPSSHDDARQSERDDAVPASWRFNPALAWESALQWGSRGLKAALGRNLSGR